MAVGLLAAASVAVLSGCTSHSTPTPSPSTSAPVASPTTAPVIPFSATAPASVALTHFDAALQALLKTNGSPDGDTVIATLTKAGFDKKAMQITPDQTTIGRAVDSIEFSVLWQGKTCLLGQVGASGYSSSSAPVLSTGACLVGTTRAIN